MRFHLIDRIDDWEPDRRVLARKAVAAFECEPAADGGDARFPACLALEALCQAGTWLLMLSTGYERRAALLSVESVDVASAARPGDLLHIEGRVVAMHDEAAVLDGTVTTASGDLVLSATAVMCALIDAGSLEDVEATRRMGALLTGAVPVGAGGRR